MAAVNLRDILSPKWRHEYLESTWRTASQVGVVFPSIEEQQFAVAIITWVLLGQQ